MPVVKDRFSQSSVRLPNRTSPLGPRFRSDLSIKGFFMGHAPSPRSSAEHATTPRNSSCLTLHNIASTPHSLYIRVPRLLHFAPPHEKAPGKQLLLRGLFKRYTLIGRTHLVCVPATHGLSERALTLIQYDIAVLVLGLEECLISVDPHRDRQHVARHDGLTEATVHALKARRIRITKRMK